MKITKVKYDVVIVGAGITGLAHAVVAVEKGYSVLLLEKESQICGASIQNYGVISPMGQPTGKRFDRAMRSREKWIEMGEKAGFWINTNGSLYLAYHHAELDVISEYHELFGYQTNLCKASVAESKYAAIQTSGLLGALFSPHEITVDPKKAVYALLNWLKTHQLCDVKLGTHVLNIQPHVVQTLDEEFESERIIVCTGGNFDTLFDSKITHPDITLYKLQMIKTESFPGGLRVGPSLVAGNLLIYLESFEGCSSIRTLRHYIQSSQPESDKYGIQTMIAQNWEGELIIGNSTEAGSGFTPFNSQNINHLLITSAKKLLKGGVPPVKYTWNGYYAKPDHTSGLVFSPLRNVTVITGLGGAGMTLSFGLAEEVLDVLSI
jgi:FAD dependent oxidoreductase TIGR03364